MCNGRKVFSHFVKQICDRYRMHQMIKFVDFSFFGQNETLKRVHALLNAFSKTLVGMRSTMVNGLFYGSAKCEQSMH